MNHLTNCYYLTFNGTVVIKDNKISRSVVETVGNSKGVVQAVWVTRSVIHKAAVSTKTNWQAMSCKIYYNHRFRAFADPEPREYW